MPGAGEVGAGEVEVALVAVLLLGWALLDAALRPTGAYRALGWRKGWWLLVVLLLPTLGALAHLLVARPRLRVALR